MEELNERYENASPFGWSDSPSPSRDLTDIALGLAAMLVATLVGLAFDSFGLETCVVIAYVLAVQVTALFTLRRIHCLLESALAVALYNYFFTVPRHSLTAWGATYPGTFAVMFVGTLISSYAAMALRREVHRSREAQRRSTVMLQTNRLLQGCEDRASILDTTGAQLARMAHHACVWYEAQPDGSMAALTAWLPTGQKGLAQELAPAMPPLLAGNAYVGTPLGHEAAQASAYGVYLTVYDKPAQDESDPDAPATAGVFALDTDEESLTQDEANLAAAIAGEASLALGRNSALEEREHAAVLAKNEQLRANLLRSISHDLRTPLTSIAGNADVLLSDGAALDAAQRDKLAADIREDASWLTATVENLLALTRLENGEMSLKPTVELMDDIVEEALRHVDPNVTQHVLTVEPATEIALVNVDARLMVQVIVNLVNNAVAHTPADSSIRIATRTKDGSVLLEVADNGPGIPRAERAHVFESFYTVDDGLTDAHRSVGLGLSLCSSIMAAHGGTITLAPVEPHGCRFKLTLPAYTVPEEDHVG